MTSTQPRAYWAVSVEGRIHILVGSLEEEKARVEAQEFWPSGIFLGPVASFAETRTPYFIYNKADFYPTTNAAEAKRT